MHIGIRSMGSMQNSLRQAHRDELAATSRIASGSRLNRVKNDSAALAVSTKLDSLVMGRRVVNRSINTKLQLAEIADEGLQDIANALKRARELAVQAASETYTDAERAILQTDFSNALQEVERIAQTTKYGDKQLLRFRGVDVGFVIDQSNSMGGEIGSVQSSINAFRQKFIDADLDVHIGVAAYYKSGHSSGNDGGVDGTERVQDLGAASLDAALIGMASNLMSGVVDPYAALFNSSGVNDPGGDDAFGWRDETLKRVLIVVTDTGDDADNEPVKTQNETASELAAAGIEVHVIARNGDSGDFTTVTSATGGQFFNINDLTSATNNPLTGTGKIADQVINSIQGQSPGSTVHIGVRGDSDNTITSAIPVEATTVGLNLTSVSVDSLDNARGAISDLDSALDQVNEMRSGLGAYRNRLESALSTNMMAMEGEQAAVSRMRDADMAVEVAAKTQASLMSQAAIGVIANAKEFQKGTIRQLVG